MHNLSYVRCLWIRDLLSLTVEEAAAHIGEVDIRDWLNWESNKIVAPEYVVKRIDEITLKHQNMIKALTETTDHSVFTLPDYESFDDYLTDHPGSSYMDWKIAQNVSGYTKVLEN